MINIESKTTWLGFGSIASALFSCLVLKDTTALASIPAAIGLLFAADDKAN